MIRYIPIFITMFCLWSCQTIPKGLENPKIAQTENPPEEASRAFSSSGRRFVCGGWPWGTRGMTFELNKICDPEKSLSTTNNFYCCVAK